jgi:hypothetical protein
MHCTSQDAVIIISSSILHFLFMSDFVAEYSEIRIQIQLWKHYFSIPVLNHLCSGWAWVIAIFGWVQYLMLNVEPAIQEAVETLCVNDGLLTLLFPWIAEWIGSIYIGMAWCDLDLNPCTIAWGCEYLCALNLSHQRLLDPGRWKLAFKIQIVARSSCILICNTDAFSFRY